jgi:UDPglucose--hexose-1-phosphate uridylyltransferase
MGELRKDPITREWVNIVVERAKRPSDFYHQEESRFVRISDHSRCPFCPGNESQTEAALLEYPADEARTRWLLRVVPNKFPAFHGESDARRTAHGVYFTAAAVGAHEVVIETPEHGKSLARLDLFQVNLVLSAWRERYLALRRDARIKYILIFRNHGGVAGASIDHAHSQIIGTPIIPQMALTKIRGLERFEREHGRCIYCDIIEQEQRDGQRIVTQNRSFIAFAPFASRHPFEIWILPFRRDAHFVNISRDEQRDLAAILKETLLRLDLCLSDPPYNLMLLTTDFSDQFHWHIEIIPRLSIAAGFELGTGIFCNVTAPEQAAQFLREVVVSTSSLETRHLVMRRN